MGANIPMEMESKVKVISAELRLPKNQGYPKIAIFMTRNKMVNTFRSYDSCEYLIFRQIHLFFPMSLLLCPAATL